MACASATLTALALQATACNAKADSVRLEGDAELTSVVLETIRAAEAKDSIQYAKLTGVSIARGEDGARWRAPPMGDVDRRDEQCSVGSVEAMTSKTVEVLWTCAENVKPKVERMFLVESGRVTYMWNDWVNEQF